jgi:hypothetical protein
VPDEAEVANPARRREHSIGDRVATNGLQHRVGALVEAFDGRTETALAG